MDKEYELTCNDCGEEFTIIANTEPSQCPFCGADLSHETEEDEDWNDED
jgi:rubrerythrin